MEIRLTSRKELRSGQFWWRNAFLLLWFAAIVFVSNEIEDLAAYLLIAAVLIGFAIGRLFPGTPIDFLGMALVGMFACSLLTPAIYATLQYRADNYTTLNRTVDLAELACFILIAMIIGFFLTRYVGKSFLRSNNS